MTLTLLCRSMCIRSMCVRVKGQNEALGSNYKNGIDDTLTFLESGLTWSLSATLNHSEYITDVISATFNKIGNL